MRYQKILRQIAVKENTSVTEVEKEMQKALIIAGLDCSVKEFIEIVARQVTEKTIYSNIV